MTDIQSKAFISYAWSSPAHEQWVLDLATRLMEDGVEIKLDKWDLGVGQDKYAFMESMISDKSVNKVIMICDKVYVEKANKREGGAGTEAQILTPELYKSVEQSKFAAVIRENDPDGNAYVPTFFAGRIYISYVDEMQAERSYEELLRWLLGKPLHVKPKLGTPPEFITNPSATVIGTVSTYKRAADAIREARPTAAGLVREYADVLVAELSQLRPVELTGDAWDEHIVSAANAMRPYIRQLGELIVQVARFTSPAIEQVLDLHERLARLMYREADITSWHSASYDPFKMVAYESFLQLIAILLHERRYDFILRAIERPYYVNNPDHSRGPATRSFTVFCNHVGSLEVRKNRLQLRWIDYHATIMHEAQEGHSPIFEQLMQADFLLFLVASAREGVEGRWYPRTLVYRERMYSPFELFARSESRTFFENSVGLMLGNMSIDRYKEALTEIQSTTSTWFDHRGIAVSYFGNFEHVGTRP
jgi:hypothetical protein